jgi:hypothetical protein
MMIPIEKRSKGETFKGMAKANKGEKGEQLMEEVRFIRMTTKKKKQGQRRSKTPTNYKTNSWFIRKVNISMQWG